MMILLVVELDYLPDSKVFVFSCVYTPQRLYTPKECTLFHAGEYRGGYPPMEFGGKQAPEGKIVL
jgi:hypothetical protein